ncbi:multidrug effflux MFS transporter [Aquimarina sp. RZ0]|uniref:multidrug effflux MFS transporter n=1 Tax=Aquimarina sp. RZ0 TaxID=2607730 RepID=UPI0011F3BB65|nr:multidrug effflux MFS transporter [Aquimarina sp. RZ0]KAA1244678.1 multidrug effflux MFS transporter [Aquimarina sp. RZ0]
MPNPAKISQYSSKISQFEFVALMAALMSIAALALDALLPALEIIGLDIGVTDPIDNQLLVIMIFLGLGIGPLFFGPISDTLGRKPIVYMGFGLFVLSSFICIYAQSLEVMLLGRILQGIGLSAPRTISIAIVRDMYDGDYMARIMSFITVVFILVPVIAPTMGKLIMDYYDWQTIFYVQAVFSILVSLWFWKRQSETLKPENKVSLSVKAFTNGFKEVILQKQTIGYTLISGFIVGSFLVYLSASQQIFEIQYGLKEEFPYIFAATAISIGSAIYLNGTLVIRLGMKRLIHTSLYVFFAVSLLYVLLYSSGINPHVGILIGFFCIQFAAIGFLFGNLRAVAMEPLGHIAGMAAAITGFISTIMAVPISIFIGKFVVTTVLPLFIGFLICAVLSIIILLVLKISTKK